MSDAKIIHVVYGQCGEYSDRTEWFVAAYTDPDEAEKHSDLCATQAKKINDWYDEATYSDGPWPDKDAVIATSADPQMEDSHYAANYCVLKVPVFDIAPTDNLIIPEETGHE